MFKTIFSKMIVIFISILLTAFLIIGIMLNLFLDYFVTDEKASSLEKSGEIVSHSFEIFIENYDDLISRLITRNLFENSLKLYSNYTNSYIWIVTQDGYIWFSEPLIPEEIKNKLMDIQGNVKLPDERQYKKVMSGQYSVVREIGDFYGFFNNRIFHEIGGKWLTVQKPFRYKPSYSNEEFVGAVYLHTPVPEIQKARVAVFKFFIISVIVAAIVSVMLVYLFSQRITRPLRQINEVAKIITQGNFGERLNIESQDEIGELAISFNQMATSLENLEEMRKGFIANVSHELRTPMTSIRGFIEGILDGTIPQEKHQYYLNIVAQETDRLLNK
jgi:methyl-accepting chemotaxis protein